MGMPMNGFTRVGGDREREGNGGSCGTSYQGKHSEFM